MTELTGNEPYFPFFETNANGYGQAVALEFQSGNNIYLPYQQGVTIRQQFASNEKLNPEDLSLYVAKTIMESDPPQVASENLKWWITAEMKYRVMKADALIKALNEHP